MWSKNDYSWKNCKFQIISLKNRDARKLITSIESTEKILKMQKYIQIHWSYLIFVPQSVGKKINH